MGKPFALNVRTQLIGTFVLFTMSTLLGTAIGNMTAIRMHRDAEELYEKALIPANAISDVMRSMHDARAQLLLGLQHDPEGKWHDAHDHEIDQHINTYSDDCDDAKYGLASYLKQPGLSDDEKKLVLDAQASLEGFNQAGEAIIASFSAGDYQKANELILRQANPALTQLGEKVNAVEMMLIKRSKQQNLDSGQLIKRASILMWAMAGAGLIFTWGMYFYLSRNITQPLRRVRQVIEAVAQGDLTVHARVSGRTEFDELLSCINTMQESLKRLMGEINLASRAVSENAQVLSGQIAETAARFQAQQDRIVETTSALEEMSRSIEEVSQSADGVSKASIQATDLSERGSGNMKESLATIAKISDRVAQSNGAIVALCDSTTHIAELATNIREIADQTNLLALNAAIEAARAGEQGRGFAVVADEVRKLAERTVQSSDSISNLLTLVSTQSDKAIESMKQIVTDVEQGVGQTQAVSDMLLQILQASQEVSRLTHSIASATSQQSDASSQTASSMEQISSLNNDNNSSIQRVAVAAQEMAKVADQLKGMVGQFQVA